MVARIIVSAIVRVNLEGYYYIATIADKFIVHSTGGASDYLGNFRQGAFGPGGEVYAIGGIVEGIARRAWANCEVRSSTWKTASSLILIILAINSIRF